MRAAAAGKSTLGIPRKVGKEFSAADSGAKLPRMAGAKLPRMTGAKLPKMSISVKRKKP